MHNTRKTLSIGKKQLYASNIEKGQITSSKEEVTKAAEEFYRKLYSSIDRKTKNPSMETMIIEVHNVSKSEIKQALNRMSRGKTEGADGLSIDLIKPQQL